MRPMRVLAVLYCYPPLLVPASICYAKLVLALRRQGVEVEIVTITEDSFDSPGPIPLDPGLLEVVPEDVVAHRVRSRETSWPVRVAKRLDRARRFTYPWLEPKKREWIGPALAHLERLDLGGFDAVLTCSQPHANHLLGLELQRRTGLPWVAYLSDPWTDNPYASFGTDRVRSHNRALEDEVYARADRVLFTCPEMLEHVLERHDALDPAKTGSLPHAWVPEWYGHARVEVDGAATARVEVLQTGSFYGPRTPLPLVEALEDLRSRRSLEGELRIDSYGGMDPRHAELVRSKGLAEVFRVRGFIPYLQTLTLMPRYRALLLVDAPVTERAESIFLPSKLVDYVGAGVPIIAATPERGATARVVRDVGGVICPLERPQALREALEELLTGEGVQAERREEAAAAYHVDRIGTDLARVLSDAVAERNSR